MSQKLPIAYGDFRTVADLSEASDGAVRWLLHTYGLSLDLPDADLALADSRNALGNILLSAIQANADYNQAKSDFLEQGGALYGSSS